MSIWRNYKRFKKEALLVTMGNWRNNTILKKETLLVTMSNWRSYKRLKKKHYWLLWVSDVVTNDWKRNIIGYYEYLT